MYRNYKIVCVTPAGRRRYMQYLIPQIITSDIIDRYDIWINTVNKEDIYFFKKLSEKYPVINLVWQPDGKVNGNMTINAFYKKCIADDCIYFKLDDDIVWMEPGLIKKMVDFRIDNPDYFLVSPLVINNALCTYILEVKGLIKLRGYMDASASHSILWRSGTFASSLHDWFIRQWLLTGKYADLHCGKFEIGMTRFSINAILWFGSQMKAFGGIIPDNPGDDEEFLSCIYPASTGKCNCVNGDAIVSHFAFFTQRRQLDRESVLERYGKYLHMVWNNDDELKSAGRFIQETMMEIEAERERIQEMDIPYVEAVHVKRRKSFVEIRENLLMSILPAKIYNHRQESRAERKNRKLIIM